MLITHYEFQKVVINHHEWSTRNVKSSLFMSDVLGSNLSLSPSIKRHHNCCI